MTMLRMESNNGGTYGARLCEGRSPDADYPKLTLGVISLASLGTANPESYLSELLLDSRNNENRTPNT